MRYVYVKTSLIVLPVMVYKLCNCIPLLTVIASILVVTGFLGRLLRVDLITLVGLKCPSVRPYVRPSTKSFFDFNEISYVGRGRRVMHDGMQYDPI